MPEIPVECPECKKLFKKSLPELREKFDATCPSCGASIHVDASDLVRKIKKGMDDFARNLKRL